MRYTVLLKYPDYASSFFASLAMVLDAGNPEDAEFRAKVEAASIYPGLIRDFEDFLAIAVFEGEHIDKKP